jgi:N utilization substance protein B
MINRRNIREKVTKALYAFFQSDNQDLIAGEKELFHSIDKIYEIFLYYAAVGLDLKNFAANYLEERKLRRITIETDLNPSLNFVKNRIFTSLEENEDLKRKLNKFKIHWNDHQDLIKKIYFSFKDEEFFNTYLIKSETTFADDKDLLIRIFKDYVFTSEGIDVIFEEKSIYWLDDIVFMQQQFIKFMKSINEKFNKESLIPSLHKDKAEDLEFASELFRKTVLNNGSFQKEISARTKNWEIERIAKMDVILLKLAICELTEFPSIPVKVTLDEYIEISKLYSSPESKSFINGILDKLVIDFKKDNKIVKLGRGLVE